MELIAVHHGHNGSACLYKNGKFDTMLQEERIRGQKNYSGFPEKVYSKLQNDKIPLIWTRKREGGFATNIDSSRFYTQTKIRGLAGRYIPKIIAKPLVARPYDRQNKNCVEHHLGHIFSNLSLVKNKEEYLFLSIDGGGDQLTELAGIFNDNKFKRIWQKHMLEPSVALLYLQTTRLLGFKPLEHEYKIMGLSAYSKYSFYKDLLPVFMKIYNHMPHQYFWLLNKYLKNQRFDNIAGAVQYFTEEITLKLVKKLLEKTGKNKIALSGGLFMNVKLNKRIMELPGIKDVIIFPSCGDESLPFGAINYSLWENEEKIPELENIYFGDKFTREDFEKEMGNGFEITKTNDNEIAEMISENKIIARFGERMEFGARALGNRSILCNPKNLNLLPKLNATVKKRDFFMPFAASMIEEQHKELIQNDKDVEAPYMMLAFDTTKKGKEMIPAGIHQYDKTCRPQVVTKKANEGYHQLISKFNDITGIPAVLNTSFNLHGYPVVYTPQQAIFVMKNSHLKYLYFDQWLITKK